MTIGFRVSNILAIIGLSALLSFCVGQASASTQATILNDSLHYHLNKDHTYYYDEVLKQKLYSQLAITQGQHSQVNFFPKSQSVKLITAYVIAPDGTKTKATKYFVRPSQSSREAPGFTNSKTATILYPQLSKGVTTVSHWRITQKTPSPFGFSLFKQPNFYIETKKQTISIDAPLSTPLYWETKGYVVHKKVVNDRQLITATLNNHLGDYDEAHTPSNVDFNDYFLISTSNNWRDYGDTWWQFYQKAIKVTPKIKMLAKQIVGHDNAHAAEKLYYWVQQHIHYIALRSNASANYIPHTASKVLQSRFGDCKDMSTLLITLLKAVGINASPAAVNWSNSYFNYPLPNTQAFNHMMVFLPTEQIFLNPTNPLAPYNVLSLTLHHKQALILAKQSLLHHTPPGSADGDRYSAKSVISLNDKGDMQGSETITATGDSTMALRYRFKHAGSAAGFANSWLANTAYVGYGKLAPTNLKDLAKPLLLQGQWESPSALHMGKTVYAILPLGLDLIKPEHLSRFISFGKRRFPVVIGAKLQEHNITFTLPQDYHFIRTPKSDSFRNAAGEFVVRVTTKDHLLHVFNYIRIARDIYSPEEYPLLKALVSRYVQASRMVFAIQKDDEKPQA